VKSYRILAAAALLLFSPFASAAPEERVIVLRTDERPSQIEYSADLTAMKVIIRSGGVTDSSDTPVYLVRGGVVRNIRERGSNIADTSLKPWDIIIVGQKIRSR
jgi:protein involved in polysaccharide export with SLBB domain